MAASSIVHWLLSDLNSLIHAVLPILRAYGLWAVFGLIFAENIGVLIAPGESALVAAGFLSATGVFSIQASFLVASIASILGGYFAYYLGARFGHRFLLRYGRYIWIRPSMTDRVHRFFQKYGPPVVVIGRFIVPLRELQGYLAGASEMERNPYLLWSAIGAILWVATWGGAAYFLASFLHQ